jgi:hypothetical protein
MWLSRSRTPFSRCARVCIACSLLAVMLCEACECRRRRRVAWHRMAPPCLCASHHLKRPRTFPTDSWTLPSLTLVTITARFVYFVSCSNFIVSRFLCFLRWCRRAQGTLPLPLPRDSQRDRRSWLSTGRYLPTCLPGGQRWRREQYLRAMTGEISWLVEVKRGTSSLTAAHTQSGRLCEVLCLDLALVVSESLLSSRCLVRNHVTLCAIRRCPGVCDHRESPSHCNWRRPSVSLVDNPQISLDAPHNVRQEESLSLLDAQCSRSSR